VLQSKRTEVLSAEVGEPSISTAAMNLRSIPTLYQLPAKALPPRVLREHGEKVAVHVQDRGDFR
jgi:hypothetical protein